METKKHLGTVAMFILMTIALLAGAAICLCVACGIGSTAPMPIQVMYGIVTIVACWAIIRVGGCTLEMIGNLAKGKDIA